MKSGIIAGGNWIVDHVKMVQTWPEQDTLTSIISRSRSNGGSPYNILIDLARLGATFPRAGVGLVGDDEDGRAIIQDCRDHRIDTKQLRLSAAAMTSYTDVMTVANTGRRTFFHHRGANALLDVGDFDFAGTSAKHFHLGYILLLDRLDEVEEGQPRASQVLRNAKAAGLYTSLDCVSEDSDRFQSIVEPALAHVDLLFANDFEAEKLTGVLVRRDDEVRPEATRDAAHALLRMGVRSWVVIHFPEGVYACSASGEQHWQPSVRIPPSAIQGAAGAGDALAAGILLGVHEDWSMPRSLQLGVCAAAASLFHSSCSLGVLNAQACMELSGRFGYNALPDRLKPNVGIVA